MPIKVSKFKFNTQTPTIVQATQVLTTTGSTDWVAFRDTHIAVQIGGTATDINATIERSAVFPGSDGSAAVVSPADLVTITGNPSTGITVKSYIEPGIGWWRVRVTSLTGASITIGLSGKGQEV